MGEPLLTNVDTQNSPYQAPCMVRAYVEYIEMRIMSTCENRIDDVIYTKGSTAL